jgi:hypothetical protein
MPELKLYNPEYHRLHNYFRRIGITHRVSCPHTSSQNGTAELLSRVLNNVAPITNTST